jgi:phosphatidylserine/phosphatidylglycerophosphate/cardiolipin synthase-like enzyme
MRPRDRIVTSVDERRSTILDVIRGATESIAVSLFRCNDDDIFKELKRAVDRGVKVEVLVTTRAKGAKKKLRKLWAALEDTGASIHAYADPVVKYHAKYLVADEGPAVVASFNFTRKCFSKTCDALVLTHDRQVVAGLKELKAADCMERQLAQSISPRLIIGPERARQQFTSLFERATSSIRIIDAKLSDPGLIALLNALRASGVRIEVYSQKQLGDLKSHGKILLLDDKIAVVGSLALAALSLDFRREVAITVEEPAAVAEIVELFRVVESVTAASSDAPQANGLVV